MRSGFSGGQWLCCSPDAPNAHAWPENRLTLRAYYHQERISEILKRYSEKDIVASQSAKQHLFCHLMLNTQSKCFISMG